MARMVKKKESRALAVASLVMLAVFLVLWVLQVAYAYGAGYFAGLTFVVMVGTTLEVENRRAEPRAVVGVFSVIAAIFAFAAAVASFVMLGDNVAGLGFEAKGVFALFSCFACTVMGYLNLRAVSEENDALVSMEGGDNVTKEEPETKSSSSAGKACKSCCWSFVMLLIVLASLNSVLVVSDNFTLLPEASALFEIDGHVMHARCSGEDAGNGTTIFLEHGLGGQSLDWSWIQRNLSATNRVCSYDRAGYARSLERGNGRRISDQLTSESFALLQKLEISRALFVGHSFAGFNLRTLESKHPELFAGLVLVDPVVPENTRDCDPNLKYSSGIFGLGVYLAETGILRVLNLIGFINGFEPSLTKLPEDAQSAYKAGLMKQEYFRTRVDEYTYWGISCSTVKGFEGDVKKINAPVSVIVPINGIHKNNMAPVRELASSLSDDPRYIEITEEDATHTSVLMREDHARYTLDAVHEMLAKL